MSDNRTATSIPVPSDSSLPAFSAAAIGSWVLVEFAFRRGLAPLLADRIGTSLGADMASGLVFVPLAAGGIAWAGMRVGIDRPDWAYSVSLRAVGAGIAGVFGIYLLRGGAAAVYVFGFGLRPSVGSGVLGVGDAPAWALGLFLLVNGVLVPIAEELAWRGVIQTALAKAYGTSIAVVLTAVAFVLKHLIVDLSVPLFRLTALAVLAFALCGLRARYGTTSSAVAHLLVNGVETAAVVLALG